MGARAYCAAQERNTLYQLSGYQGPPAPPVLGEERPVALGALNNDEYIEFALQHGLLDEATAASMRTGQPDAHEVRERVERVY